MIGGRPWVDPRYLKTLLQNPAARGQYQKPQLSGRERAVLGGILEGLTNKEIGQRVRISESAVKAALQLLFDKTGVRTRTQLVRVALEQYRDEL